MYKLQTLTTRNTITFPIVLLISTILSGCLSDGSFGFNDSLTPKERIADYSKVNCDGIWKINDQRAYENALYWLQVMNCTKSFSTKQAQALLNENAGSEWAVSFKRSILLAQINGSDNEQRQTLDKLLRSKEKHSSSLANLMNLWIKNQQLQLSVNIEKGRYQRLKESSEAQEQALNSELQSVKAKLQSLTNIETDILSNRKSAKNGKTGSTSTANRNVETGSVKGQPPGETVPDSQPKEEQNIPPNNNN